jgi:hypothetical protein
VERERDTKRVKERDREIESRREREGKEKKRKVIQICHHLQTVLFVLVFLFFQEPNFEVRKLISFSYFLVSFLEKEIKNAFWCIGYL